MTELLLRPLADAFMQVGVFVALMVAPFGWARGFGRRALWWRQPSRCRRVAAVPSS
jgi:hypothetical protein